jgi:hypothetical protein
MMELRPRQVASLTTFINSRMDLRLAGKAPSSAPGNAVGAAVAWTGLGSGFALISPPDARPRPPSDAGATPAPMALFRLSQGQALVTLATMARDTTHAFVSFCPMVVAITVTGLSQGIGD